MSRYDDIDSPDYRDSNVGEGMIPERKRSAERCEPSAMVKRLNSMDVTVRLIAAREAAALIEQQAQALRERDALLREIAAMADCSRDLRERITALLGSA